MVLDYVCKHHDRHCETPVNPTICVGAVVDRVQDKLRFQTGPFQGLRRCATLKVAESVGDFLTNFGQELPRWRPMQADISMQSTGCMH